MPEPSLSRQCGIERGGHRAPGGMIGRSGAADLDARQWSGLLVERRRLVKDDVADRQRDGRGADAGGERNDGDERGHRVAPQVAHRAAGVLDAGGRATARVRAS